VSVRSWVNNRKAPNLFSILKIQNSSYSFAVRIVLLTLSALLLGGCSIPQTYTPPQAEAAFTRLATDYVHGYLAWRPQAGTALGLHQYDGKITDLRRSSLHAELARLQSCDQQLAGFHTNLFSPRMLHDYRLLRCAVQRELFSFEQMRVYWRNPMTYAAVLDVNAYLKRDFAPLEKRVHSIISILRQASDLMAAARANLERKLPSAQVATAIEQANGAADFLSKDLPDALKDFSTEPLKSELEKANRRAIRELRGYADWLRRHRLPAATEDYALGRERYRELLRCSELVTASPDQLLELGLLELRDTQRRFAELAAEIDPSRTPTQVFKDVQRDHPTEAGLIPDTVKNLEAIRQFIVERDLLTLPSEVRARVMETPQYLRSTTFASMDTPGVFETKATEAYYYVTPPEPAWPPAQKEEWLTAFNYYTTDVVSIHEAYPGHYVQYLCLKASPANRFEKMFTGYAFTEGWAHYAEQMMLEEGFGAPGSAATSGTATPEERVRAAKYRMAQLDEALLRLCRYCVSIKMHCQGMTLDEATRFFVDNSYYEPKPARQEAVRGTYDPEYLYYTLGKLEILKLRADYRQQEGVRFSLKAFHDELLSHGAPPIRLLRERLLKDPALWDQVL
jgi:uncharacterized protein (DUF885 family)